MRTKILLFAGIGIILATSFKLLADKSAANVDQIQGLYVFIQSKPVAEYEYLGSVKKSIGMTGQPKEMLNSVINKVKKDYPAADGVIFTTVGMDQADAVKFK